MQRLNLSSPQTTIFGEQYFAEINQLLFAKQSSEMVFKTHYAELLKQEEMLYIVVGTDSGLFYQFIRAQSLPSAVKFIFIELDQVNDALERRDEIWQGAVRWVGEDFQFARLHQDFEPYVIRKKIRLVKSMAVTDAKVGDVYYDFWQHISNKFQKFTNMLAVSQQAYDFEKARLRNAVDNMLPLYQYKGILDGVTAVILGGGPTLDDAIEWLRLHQSEVVIFSAARIAKRLKRENIVPDFFVSVDPHDVSFDNSKGIFDFADQSILLNGYHVNPKILGQWSGLKAYAGLKYGWDNRTYVANLAAPGPNVINTAVSLAVELGCKNIVLSGVDFCFAKGRGYEAGSDEAKLASHLMYKDQVLVEANNGEKIPTQIRYASGRDVMESQIAAFKHRYPNLSFFSSGWESAKINHVSFIDLSQFALISSAFKDQVAQFKEKLDVSKEAYERYVALTEKELTEYKNHLMAVRRLAEEALQKIPKMYDPVTGQPNAKALARVIKNRKKVNALIAQDGDMLFSLNAKYFEDAFKPVENEELLQTAEKQQRLEAFFKGLKASTSDYIEMLSEALERTKMRKLELSLAQKLQPLFAKWEKSAEFGRVSGWQRFHSVEKLLPEDLQYVQTAQEKFSAELGVEHTEHFKSVKKRAQNLNTLIQRAEKALSLADRAELDELAEHAQRLDNPVAQQAFSALIGAMQAQVVGDLERAMAGYAAIELAPVKHVALKHSLQIVMQQEDYNQALTLLEQLCLFSIDYMISYADLLYLLGQIQLSFDVLNLYLSQKTDRVDVRLKLAQRCIEQGLTSQANEQLSLVLQQEPNNQTARFLQKQLGR